MSKAELQIYPKMYCDYCKKETRSIYTLKLICVQGNYSKNLCAICLRKVRKYFDKE